MKTLLPLGLALLTVLAVGCSVARPLHRPEASIQASVLKHTPLGTSRVEVRKFIAEQGWKLIPDSRVPPGAPSLRDEVRFGGYALFLGTCNVYGLWTFDATNRLVDFNVSKSHDVL
jgi:hypothetical protein